MALALSKTADKKFVAIGDTILYTLSVRQNTGATHQQSTVFDTLPQGFSLIRGTVSLDGKPLPDPSTNPMPASGTLGSNGPKLSFNMGSLSQNQTKTLTYRARVGAGATMGNGDNVAQAYACASSTLPPAPASCYAPQVGLSTYADSISSSVAHWKVEVGPGILGGDACLLGKVFIDCDGDHLQSAGEIGIPGVRIYLDNGKYVVTDSKGQYSLCGLTPVSRVAQIDEATAPQGSVWAPSSSANMGDAHSLWLDLKSGLQHRGDFIESSCSESVVHEAQRRAQSSDPDTAKKWGASQGLPSVDSHQGAPK
jgi:uncharacterized repeat protein (TIGR01451 family)